MRSAEADDDLLRSVASCANEAVDAQAEPAPRVAAALQRVLQRYGRVLHITLRDVQAALQGKTETAGAPIAHTTHAALDELAAPTAGARS